MSASNGLLKAIKERTAFLDKISENIRKREERKQKLIELGMYVDEASPSYKESYTGNR